MTLWFQNRRCPERREVCAVTSSHLALRRRLRNNSGSSAKFAAMRRASSRVGRLIAERLRFPHEAKVAERPDHSYRGR